MGDAGNQRRETAALLGLRGGEGKSAHGASVKCAEEGDDILSLGVIPGELQGALDGLGAGVSVVDLVGPGMGAILERRSASWTMCS